MLLSGGIPFGLERHFLVLAHSFESSAAAALGLFRPADDEVRELLRIQARHALGEGQLARYEERDPDLVRLQVAVRGDDGPRGVVHTLAWAVACPYTVQSTMN